MICDASYALKCSHYILIEQTKLAKVKMVMRKLSRADLLIEFKDLSIK